MSAKLNAVVLGVVGLASLLVAWTIVIEVGLVSSSSLPYATNVAGKLPQLLTDGDFLRSLGDTMWGWLAALVLSSVAAVVVGVLMSTVSWLTRPATLAVNILRSIPSTALIPVAILIFGLGPQMKISVAVYATFWVVLINTMYGVASTEPMRLDAARSFHWGWLRTHTLVTLPSALPSIVTGIRIASGIALVVVLSAELLGAKSGLGTEMVRYQQSLQIDVVYAMLLITGVIGTVLYTALVRVEKLSMRWVRSV
ncbi:ABC transporter permease [Rhodococcus erythropolis]|uniref:ABC transporter permease n=1 Tax=Rhodococcus erythropolis TaxID=1833 RepID=UPI000878571E|nr:ABC transporter permease subunit [Rhodococcus erythropolis]OFV73853.1 putative aliphatic sulfonates transport permease protein SsuC [Rhodococcus erythropolis]